MSTRRWGAGGWAVVCGVALLAVQTALAGSDALTLRSVLVLLATGGAAAIVWRATPRAARLRSPAPDPANLILSGVAGLGIWTVAWWTMDLADHVLRQSAGLLPLPQILSRAPDRLLGLDLRPASYELAVLFAVVLIPLAQSVLLWGLVRREFVAAWGWRRGAWLAGVLGGGVLALSAPQQLEPALPGGLAALPGYLLVGVVASWAAVLSRSFWAGFAAHGTFAYASLALRDDLLRALAGRGYLDPQWLSAVVLGGFVTLAMLRIMHLRGERNALLTGAGRPLRPVAAWVILIAALVALAAIDLARRS